MTNKEEIQWSQSVGFSKSVCHQVNRTITAQTSTSDVLWLTIVSEAWRFIVKKVAALVLLEYMWQMTNWIYGFHQGIFDRSCTEYIIKYY